MFERVSATHVIAHISDTHLLGGRRKLFKKVDVARNLEHLLDRLESGDQSIDALVFTGDIADIAEPEAYRWIRERVEPVAERLGATLVWTMGNHDERAPFARELFDSDDDIHQDRVYDVGGLRIVALDTSVPGYHHGTLESDQIEWLRDVLSTPAEHGTVLAMHHPPIRSHNELVRLIELRGTDPLEGVVRGSDVRTILGGHLHYSTYGTFADVPVAVASATCYTVDIGADKNFLLSAVDGAQSVQLVHLYPDTVVHSIVQVDQYDQIAGYPASLRAMSATMSDDEIEEMVSSKSSDFNQAEREQSADL